MAEERDDGLLAPLSIKSKAEKFAKELRKAEDTNYDEVDNKYDAIRHIGGSLALYSQYPDTASDIILNAKEYIFGGGDERAVEMDLHNNRVGKKLYEMMDKEQRKNLTTEQALEIARSYVEEFEMADEDSNLPDDMKPVYYYKEPTKPQMNEGGLMDDPLTLSETAEEEEAPKMSLKEYAEGVRDFAVDLTPSGTADAIIETGKALSKGEYGKAAMSALGAIPGGKTAGKAARSLEVGVDESKLSGDQLRKYASATVEMLEDTAKQTGKVAGDKGEKLYAPVEEGTKVAVRKNLNSSVGEGIDPNLNTLQTLHAGSFSGKALSYMPVVTIKDAEFTISQTGRRDVAAKMLGKESKAAKSKFPMAAVKGKYTKDKSVLEQYNPEELVEIGFNPKFNHLFIDMQTGQAVKGAEEATIIGDRVYAQGIKYWKKSEAPEPLPTSQGEEISSDVRFKEMNTGGLMSDAYNRAES